MKIYLWLNKVAFTLTCLSVWRNLFHNIVPFARLIRVPHVLSPVQDFLKLTLATLSKQIPSLQVKMAVHRGYSLTEMRSKPSETTQRRRRRQSIKIQKNIDDDVLMASAIGDVTWLQQSLYDTRKVYSVSKEHVSTLECSLNHFN